jgi:hypothetical protein
MINQNHSNERGQVLILLVLGFAVLLGFAALAIDGGMLYSDRRYAQNAADASSLAGGGQGALDLANFGVTYENWDCSSNTMAMVEQDAIGTAIDSADSNGYSIDDDISDNAGVTTSCNAVDNGSWVDKYMDITSYISATTKTAFAHFVFSGPLRNHVETVTRIRPSSPLVFGNAIVALNPASCSGQQNGAGFHGNTDLDVSGGGIFSNGCLRMDGDPDVDVTDGDIHYVDECVKCGGFDPPPDQAGDTLPPDSYAVPRPKCDDPDAHNVSHLSGDIGPGLYCLTGDLRLGGGDTLNGEGVTIYLVNGGININGNAVVTISAPDPQTNPNPKPALPGILFYLDADNHSDVTINGNSDSHYVGIIYAPGSDVYMTGTGDTTAFQTQVIGWNVEFGGDAETFVEYDAQRSYHRPATVMLYK